MDDPSLMLVLSNLLHLHTYLDDSSLLPDAASPPSAAGSLVYSSSAAPLLFFAIASALSYASSSLHRSRRGGRLADSPPRPPTRSNPSLLSAPAAAAASSSFFISPDRLLSMDPSARDARFRSLYGVSHAVFDTLLKNLRRINAAASVPPSLPLDHAVALALARLSRGVSSRALARSVSLPPPLVSRATHALTRLLATRLYSRYVSFPRTDQLQSTVQSFKDLVSLPNVAGAIASSPVRLKCRRRLLHLLDGGASNSREDPVDGDDDRILRSPHRAFPSVLLQVVADHRKVFWDACVLAPGSSDPASHLRDSRLYHRLLSSSDNDKDNSGGFLRDAVINIRGHRVRPYLIGDSSYPLLPFLLTPFSSGLPSSTNAHPVHEAFDAAIAAGRASSVEAAIALLKGRWKILRNLNVGLNHVAQTVIACIVLHNMCQIAKEPEDESRYMWRDPPESPQPAKLSENERSTYQMSDNLRQVLADDLYERQQKLSGAR